MIFVAISRHVVDMHVSIKTKSGTGGARVLRKCLGLTGAWKGKSYLTSSDNVVHVSGVWWTRCWSYVGGCDVPR